MSQGAVAKPLAIHISMISQENHEVHTQNHLVDASPLRLTIPEQGSLLSAQSEIGKLLDATLDVARQLLVDMAVPSLSWPGPRHHDAFLGLQQCAQKGFLLLRRHMLSHLDRYSEIWRSQILEVQGSTQIVTDVMIPEGSDAFVAIQTKARDARHSRTTTTLRVHSPTRKH